MTGSGAADESFAATFPVPRASWGATAGSTLRERRFDGVTGD